ncbi:MAG: glycosyltransferase family 4 protein [Actinomycetota bacterium]
MKLVVVVPHFAPDTAPTGAIFTRIVEELGDRGHHVEVITALPWYREHRIEPGYEGRLTRVEDTPWGRIVRVHPFPTSDKRDLVRRAAAFSGFSLLAGAVGIRGGAVDGVLAMSPPLTLGLDGWAIARARRARLVFNIQDVFPDVAVELGVLTNRPLIEIARSVERFCYKRADAVTVLSDDLKGNLSQKINPEKVHVIPNFVDTDLIRPSDKENPYRREFGLQGKTVVMYAGNVGLSQSLELMLEAAVALAYEPDLVFVINGQGAARDDLRRRAGGMDNVRFVEAQPMDRLPEVLAAADIHLVPLKRGLAAASVPSKTYSILAAGRPLIASVDAGSEITRVVERSGAGISIPPEDAEALTKAIRRLLDAPEEGERMGRNGRAFVEGWASPGAVAEAYEDLFVSLPRP